MDSGEDIAARAQAALDRGDPFAAYDIAAEHEGAAYPALAYIRVLTLARLGDWRGALARYEAEGLDRQGDIDSLALKARLLKDKAFDSHPSKRTTILREARDAYLAAFERTGEAFAAINAASLSSMIGERSAADSLARAALERTYDGGGYWAVATRAEALANIGRFEEARHALEQACRLPDATVAARNSTYQQIGRLLAGSAAIDEEGIAALLRPIRPRRTAHFCGAMFLAGGKGEARLAEEIATVLREEDVGMIFGALACGSDIVIAEQALALGIELHAIFPFARSDFIAQSVDNGGSSWRERFERCAAAATGTHFASRMRFVSDDAQFAFGSRTAMGMARLRAAQLNAEAIQIAVCDDPTPTGLAGTAADIATWRDSGGRTRVIPAMGLPKPPRAAPLVGVPDTTRALRVLVFADFAGFSRLPEQVIPHFWQTVMAACASSLARHARAILTANTWGDGLHLVIDSVDSAAPMLVDLRDALLRLDLTGLGATDAAGMRIAAHFGSVYEMTDPITRRANFYGTEVSRAARLEAATPPGTIYVTEPMAAAIEMACADRFVSRYVGVIALPKNFGTERIYALEQRRSR